MPTYDLDLDKPLRVQKKGSGWGCSIGGWFVFALVAALTIFVGYRTWGYYTKIKSGQIVDLPQFRERLTSIGNKSGATPITSAARTEVELATAPAQGPEQPDARLVVVEFADFQCPYSKDEALVVRTLMQKYGDKVRFEFRDYPIEELHPDAIQAAVAARCAQEQGKFWEYHDKLFVNSPSLTKQMLLQFATEIGLDSEQFSRCLSSQRYRPAVESDMTKAQSLGIQGTPTFYLNGSRVDGAIPMDVFENLIQKITQ
jgi:protein-disulfide isomerase